MLCISMEQFIFDVLKMYIEFILYNYDLVYITYHILIVLFWASICVTACNLKINASNDIRFIAWIFVVVLILIFSAYLLPSPETLQALIK